MIPPYDVNGNLPPGIHTATLEEVKARCGISPYRRQLLKGLEMLVANLQSAGCRILLLDGSFITAKVMPGDFDGLWLTEGVDATKLDPVLLRRSSRSGQEWREAMKRKYKGEVFPTTWGSAMLDFFQTDKLSGDRK
jgi:hypothetical protein